MTISYLDFPHTTLLGSFASILCSILSELILETMGDDITSLDDDERAIELSSIAAIYPEIVLDAERPFEAKLDLQVAPAFPVKIQFTSLADGAPPGTHIHPPKFLENAAEVNTSPNDIGGATDIEADDLQTLTYLPPISVRISLPDGYPTKKPPNFEITTSPAWLPKVKLDDLVADGVRLWKELGQDQVVFAYIDYLQQEAENAFGLAAAGADTLSVSGDLKIALLDFDIQAKREKFEKGTYDCGICLEPKKGSVCHRMISCSHVFCIACLQDFYNNCITEGEVDNVKCLDPSCGREERHTSASGKEQADPARSRKRRRRDPTLNPSELLQIPIAQELVQRYVHLKRKKRLESDKSTVYCPRQWCQGAARSKKYPKPLDLVADNPDGSSESEEEDEKHSKLKTKKKGGEDELPPMSERLCVCEDCSYAFCSVCKKGWHGELTMCNPRKQAELNAEEKASEDYLKLHTTPCPTCAAPSQKTMGCNHMICFKCKTHFCYLCSSYLLESNPYEHFNNHKSTCYMRLRELEGGDGAQVDHRFQGGLDNWVDEETEDDENTDDASIHSGDTDILPDGPNWRLGDLQAVEFAEDSDSEDDVWPGFRPQLANAEPAPRPEPRIEIINFAQAGVRNPRHIPMQGQANIQPRNARNGMRGPPPPAPAPPIRNDNRLRNQQQHRQPIQPENQHLADLGIEIEVEGNQRGARAMAAPGQGNEAALQPAPVRAMGLERFLELARDNREDEWDSDELEDDFAAHDAADHNW